MSVLEIKKAGNKILKEICSPVERIDRTIRTLLDDMAETMYRENGVGLAAPQVGKTLRIVVIDVGDGLIELINPQIIEKEGQNIDSEGCLSIPEVFGEVERYEKVTVEGLNRRGKKQRIQATGLFARAIQHELDHLDGILFIDRARTISRSKTS